MIPGQWQARNFPCPSRGRGRGTTRVARQCFAYDQNRSTSAMTLPNAARSRTTSVPCLLIIVTVTRRGSLPARAACAMGIDAYDRRPAQGNDDRRCKDGRAMTRGV
jgi:hypothetical protein